MNPHATRLPPAALAAMVFLAVAAPAWGHSNVTTTVVGFSANPVVEGTPVTVTATVTFTGEQSAGSATGHTLFPTAGDPVVGDSVNFQWLSVNGDPVPCGTVDAVENDLGSAITDASGVATLGPDFDTTGFGGMTIGFHAVHPNSGGPHGNATSQDCQDLVVTTAGDPLPDGSTTFTQGFYGASPNGEPLVEDLIDEATCEEIVAILTALGFDFGGDPPDCSDAAGRAFVALLLTGDATGETPQGQEDPPGFLPSGFNPGDNLGAQKITLLLNLNLGLILDLPEIPIEAGYFLNIDPVQDIVAGVPDGFFDPILTTGGELGVCTDTTPADGVCDVSTVGLTPFGEKFEDLDEAGTTVQDILDAADDLLDSGDPEIVVNGVTLTRDDVADLLGLINESFDEGVPTGVVTAFDAD